MAPKKAKRTKRKQHGKGPKELAAKALQLAKESQIISKALAMSSNPMLQGIGEAAAQLGYGRQHGAGIFDGLGNLAMGVGTGAGNLAMGLGGGLHSLFGSGRQRGGSFVPDYVAHRALFPQVR